MNILTEPRLPIEPVEMNADPLSARVVNGGGETLPNQATVDAIDQAGAESRDCCEHCSHPFTPRTSGGKAQRFCSTECRKAFHNAERTTSQANDETVPDENSAKPREPSREQPEVLVGIGLGAASRAVVSFPKPVEREHFDWGVGNPDIVVVSQPATAIYLNPWDQIVIRQEAETGDDDDDHFVRFTRENLPALIARLQAIAKVSS
jgi:hypothetical protein